ncbi:S-layer protein [Geobacillus sp. GHH01]|uniref:S-layer protein n=1 Tax=Geobacillus sp. GHH01 TaxID=1233873 RepID=UPI0002AF3CF9|nr:S-layer protein [Geobacillus sp. GHH01]AGE23757.1 S-layer protein [Geobacillus sp. GHH01]
MDKKKAVKLATASAVAASAFVAANPHASQAATDVATVVSQAKAQMKQAYYTYSHTVTETGQFPDINDVYAAYNKAKQAYANAVAVVNKAGGAKKDAYLADLQATYETYVFKANPKSGEARVATYIDAYNYATKLDAMRQELKAAVDAKDLKKAEELYHKISYELRTRTVILDRVYGQTTRELLRSTFKADAQALRDSLIYDITVAMKAREAQDAVKAGNLDKAKAALDQVNQYVSKVTDAFKAELQKAAQDANAAYEAALTPKVESVSAINAKELVVKFNKAIDKNTIIDDKGTSATGDDTLKSGVVKINGSDAASNYASLSADGKTLTIQLASYTAGANVKFELINDGTNYVKSVDGKKVPAYAGLVTTEDTTRAELTKVEYVTPEKVRVYFSEPVQNPAAGELTVAYADGTSVSLTPTQPSGAAVNYVEFDISGLTAGKDTKITFNGIKDYANNVSKPISVTVKKDDSDKVAPTVQSIVATSPTTFEIKFSENLKTIGAGAVKVNGTAVTGAGTSVAISSTDSSVVKVTLASPVTGVVPVVVEADVARDFNGNKNTEFTQLVNFNADKVAPEIQSYKVVNKNSENYLVLTFSEAVSKVSTANLDFKYTDKFGVTQTITVPNSNVSVTSDAKVVEIKLEDNATPAADLPSNIAFTVDIPKGFFKDGFNNDSVAKNFNIYNR